MQYRVYDEGQLHVVFGITDSNRIRLLHFSEAPFVPAQEPEHYYVEGYQFAILKYAGVNSPYEKQGSMYVAAEPGCSLLFEGIEESENEQGRRLVITQKDPKTGAVVETTVQFYRGLSTARFENTVINAGSEAQTIEYIGSFCYLGFEKEGLRDPDDKMLLYIPHNSWQKELSWESYTFAQLGLPQTQPHIFSRTSKTIEVTNTGHWSAKSYLPMGYIENTDADTGLFFQIEHNGSWHYEIGMQNDHFFLNVSGPTEIQSHFSKTLQPGESFTSVPVAAGVSHADISEAISELTQYRRRIRRPNADDENLPVIFNDYMNCLMGDPRTSKELPLVDAAAKAGCEYFVIDAGWYAPGEWWSGVGEWQECRERFPNGVKEVTDYARSKGLIPGVWLELEVMGIDCDKAKNAPDDWFFVRHGKRVYDRSRYQLDFRNPAVIDHVNEVIDRVVNDYGVGYIKMDYNIEPGIGTELDAQNFGDGLLQHERAYLAWLDSVFARYPDLVIENCSSGGLRMDYAMLSRYSIQSTSDQEDYIHYSTIAANVPTGVTPEQAAVWSYPLRQGDPEEAVFNMVNVLLCRIHQSGHLAEISDERFALVQEGISYYKSIRQDIKKAVPYWPIGLAHTLDPWVCLGLRTQEKCYLAVWRRGGDDFCRLPLADLWRDLDQAAIRQEVGMASGGQAAGASETEASGQAHGIAANVNVSPVQWKVSLAYPQEALAENCAYEYDSYAGVLTVEFKKPVMARVFEISRV
ncbi:MAG: alpha-galactosidase [Eubacteriales bacterium]|nr:alpha-galactosidase [Eubacteriales bacterium]